MFLKPLIKTVILSSLIFGLVVVLGMKYHWSEYFKVSPKQNVELTLPEAATQKPVQNKEAESNEFVLEIIRSEKQSVTANLTKEQTFKACQQLYNKMGMQNNILIDVVIGDCVVSNYQEPIQTIKKPVNNKTPAQLKVIENACHHQANAQPQLTPVEKQLLIGVCVSGGVNH